MTSLASFARLAGAAAIWLAAASGASGCVTDGLLRRARGDADLQALERAWTTPEGGLAVRGRMALGTFTASSFVVVVDAGSLDAALRGAAVPVRLPEGAATRASGEQELAGDPVAVVAVTPYSFDWESELASLEPPEGQVEAVFYQGRAPFLFHLRPVRFAHVRVGPGGVRQQALFELASSKDGARPLSYLLLPVTAAVEGLASLLLFSSVLGLAGLAL